MTLIVFRRSWQPGSKYKVVVNPSEDEPEFEMIQTTEIPKSNKAFTILLSPVVPSKTQIDRLPFRCDHNGDKMNLACLSP